MRLIMRLLKYGTVLIAFIASLSWMAESKAADAVQCFEYKVAYKLTTVPAVPRELPRALNDRGEIALRRVGKLYGYPDNTWEIVGAFLAPETERDRIFFHETLLSPLPPDRNLKRVWQWNFASVSGLNNAGAIVGQYFNAGVTRRESYVLMGGRWTKIPTLAGGEDVIATAINDNNAVVGDATYANVGHSGVHAFLYEAGSM